MFLRMPFVLTTQVSADDLMTRMPSRQSIFWCLTGGGAFWLPVIVLYAVFRDRVSVIALNLAPLAGLALLSIVSRVRGKEWPRWSWVLAGIYILGPVAMEIAPLTGGFNPAINQSDWLWLFVLALLPPVTLWFATLNGMIISVLMTTVLLIVLAGLRNQHGTRRVD